MIEVRYTDGVIYDTFNGEEVFKLREDNVQDVVIVNHTLMEVSRQVVSGSEVSINRSAHTISISGTNGIVSYVSLYKDLKYLITVESDPVQGRLKVIISTVERIKQDD